MKPHQPAAAVPGPAQLSEAILFIFQTLTPLQQAATLRGLLDLSGPTGAATGAPTSPETPAEFAAMLAQQLDHDDRAAIVLYTETIAAAMQTARQRAAQAAADAIQTHARATSRGPRRAALFELARTIQEQTDL